MAIEIERKFLLTNDSWRNNAEIGQLFIQGYLAGNKTSSVRVRIEGEQANINIKSSTLGIYRSEFEYSIPLDDAHAMLSDLCAKPLIEKTRYKLKQDDHTWEIDEFTGGNKGLIVAEIELSSTDEVFTKPAWLGEEVSDDPRYYNVCLVTHPFKDW